MYVSAWRGRAGGGGPGARCLPGPGWDTPPAAGAAWAARVSPPPRVPPLQGGIAGAAWHEHGCMGWWHAEVPAGGWGRGGEGAGRPRRVGAATPHPPPEPPTRGEGIGHCMKAAWGCRGDDAQGWLRSQAPAG